MKQLIFISLLSGICACTTPSATPEKAQTTASAPQHQTVQIVFIADRSKSFVRHYSFPDPALFKPLCDKISKNATIDFRYGIISKHSDITFDRYFVPHATESPRSANPWLSTGQKTISVQPTNWNDFASSVNSKLTASPSNGSDVSSAISHALVFFQEDTKATRKILFLCTDGFDTYRQPPPVPPDIEVITVGILPDNHIERVLNTNNIRRFENLNAGIDFLLFQTF